MKISTLEFFGQFLNLIQRGESKQPLRKLQLIKDIWKECKQMLKENLLNYLINYANVEGNSIANICTTTNKLQMYLDYLFQVLDKELYGYDTQ